MNILTLHPIIKTNSSALTFLPSVKSQENDTAVRETALKSLSSNNEDKKSKPPMLIRLKKTFFPQPVRRSAKNEPLRDGTHELREAVCFLNENPDVKALESWLQSRQSDKNQLLKAELSYVQDLEAFYKSEQETTQSRLKSLSSQSEQLEKNALTRASERKELMKTQSLMLMRFHKRIAGLERSVDKLKKEINDLEIALNAQNVKTQKGLKRKFELLELQNAKIKERNRKKMALKNYRIRLQRFKMKMLKQDSRLLSIQQIQIQTEKNIRIQLEKDKVDLENYKTEIEQWLEQLQALKRAKYEKIFIRSGNFHAHHLKEREQDALIKTWMENPSILLFMDEKTAFFGEKKEALKKIQEDPDKNEKNLASLYLQMGKKTLRFLEKKSPVYDKTKRLLSELKSALATDEKTKVRWNKAQTILIEMSRLIHTQ